MAIQIGPAMIEFVTAETFVRRVAGPHATEPFILRCKSKEGLVDVFTKVAWAGCPVAGLASEVITNALALDLGFSVPQAVYVDYDDDFIDAVRMVEPIIAARMKNSVRPAFGTVKLPHGLADAQAVPADVSTAELARIWAFDCITLNPDRRTGKPNCMTDGTRIYLIDHEKALYCQLLGSIVCPYPWVAGALRDGERRACHLFTAHIRGHQGALIELRDKIDVLDDAVLDGYAGLLPATWTGHEEHASRAVAYLKLLRQNLDPTFSELYGALQ